MIIIHPMGCAPGGSKSEWLGPRHELRSEIFLQSSIDCQIHVIYGLEGPTLLALLSVNTVQTNLTPGSFILTLQMGKTFNIMVSNNLRISEK